MSTLRLNGAAVTLNGDDVTLNGADAGATLSPTLFTEADFFGSHSLAAGPVSLTAALYSDTDFFGAASVAAGLVTLSPSVLADADWFGAAALSVGPVALAPPLVAEADWFGAHSVSTSGSTQTLNHTLYADPDFFGAAAVTVLPVTLQATRYIDPDWFGTHAVSLSSNTQTLLASIYYDPDWFGVTDPYPEPEEGELPLVTIPELPAQAVGSVSDDDLLVMLDTGSGEARKVTRADLLAGVARSGLPATLGAVDASTINAPTGAIETLTVATGLVLGSTLQRVLYSTSSVAVPTVGAGTQGSVTVTVTGAVTTDWVTANASALPAGLIMSAAVTAPNTVTLYFWNATAASIAGANYTIRVLVQRVV